VRNIRDRKVLWYGDVNLTEKLLVMVAKNVVLDGAGVETNVECCVMVSLAYQERVKFEATCDFNTCF